MNFSFLLSAGFYLIVCSIGTLAMFHPTIFSGFSRMQSYPADSRLNNYILEHSFQFIFNPNYPKDFWSATFFYPLKNTIALTENLLGTSPLYWLFRLFNSPETSFQVWTIAVTILNFFSLVFLLRQLKVNPILSALGGFVFAFGMPRIGQLNHEQLLVQFWTSIAFLFLWNFLRRPTIRSVGLFFLFTYLQVLSGIYLGWLFLFSVLIMIPVSLYFDPFSRLRLFKFVKQYWKACLGTFLVWLLFAVLLFLPYLKVSHTFGVRSFAEVATMLPRLSSWFFPPAGTLWDFLRPEIPEDLPMPWEHQLFIGIIFSLLTGFSVYCLRFQANAISCERSLLIKVCLTTALILFILSLSVADWSLWQIVYTIIPGATAIRSVTRIGLVIDFYLIIATLVCFDSFIKTMIRTRKSRIAIVTLICLAGILEQISFDLPSFEKSPLLAAEAEVQTLISSGCNVAYISMSRTTFPVEPSIQQFYATWSTPKDILPPSSNTFSDFQQTAAMWIGIKSGVPVINGRSGFLPQNYPNPYAPPKIAELIQWLGDRYQGTLCFVSDKTATPSLGLKTLRSSTISSDRFTLSRINLPVPKPAKLKIGL